VPLERAQPHGVRRGDVDRQVVRNRVKQVEQREIVLRGLFDRRIASLADVDPDHDSRRLAATQPVQQRLPTSVRETPAVDQGLIVTQAEQARPGVAGLRERRHSAKLQMAKTEARQPMQGAAVFVIAPGEPDLVGEVQAEGPHTQAVVREAEQASQGGAERR
jgi:hypothetical protein